LKSDFFLGAAFHVLYSNDLIARSKDCIIRFSRPWLYRLILFILSLGTWRKKDKETIMAQFPRLSNRE
jgi:hypothetical protein